MPVRATTRRTRFLAIVALLIVVPGCAGSDETPAQEPAQDVVQAYFEAWNTRDIDQIMSHVAEDASLEIDPAGVMWNTPDDIRTAFETMFAKSEWTVEVSDFEVVADDTVSYNFRISSPAETVITSGRSEATVENGLIKTEKQIGAYRDEA